MYLKSQSAIFCPLGTGQIRLIHLQPGLESAPIICRLETVHLENAPAYAALSYVWGSPEPVDTVTVNDQAIGITKNLHSALLHVRQESSIITLWVDALCIFQDDKLEKSQQVQIMGDIFRTATNTFIWLGESSENDQIVIDYLRRQQDPDSPDFQLKGIPIEALQYFFERPWFRRVWILQEAILSKQPTVQYGCFRVPFSRVLRLSTDLLIDNLGNHRGDIFAKCPLKRCMQEWDLLQEVVNQRGGWPLVYALPMTERMESTLFEDRVYALLGLATLTDRQSIKPDYSKPLESLQREISAHLISSSDAPLEALHSMGIRVASEVPSWGRNWTVPTGQSWALANPSRRKVDQRWSMLPPKNEIGTGYERLNLEVSNKPWLLKTPSKIGNQFVRFSEDLWTCAVRGVAVDRVDSVYVAPKDEIELMRECERWKDAAVQSATAWSTPEARLEAFCKALCFGHYLDNEGHQLTDCHAAYQTWIKGLDSLGPNGTVLSPTMPIKNDFGHRVKRLTLERSFFITKKGFLGLGRADTRPGDMICYFERSNDPFILRSLPAASTEAVSTMFVGDTAILGLMSGEGLKDIESKDIVEYWIQ